jgi:RNA polymerase sigma-70 factor (ECF subfamily)
MTDSVLTRIGRGEAGAVSACVDQFGPLVWALARRLSPTSADAEDAVQEIFLDLWKSASRFDPQQGSEKVFVTTIARRRLIDRLRRLRKVPLSDDLDILDRIGWADPGTRGEVCAEAERAAQAVAGLSAEQQRVIGLAVLQGLSHSEIAAETGLPLGTVKTQMRRGLLRARAALGLGPPLAEDSGP